MQCAYFEIVCSFVITLGKCDFCNPTAANLNGDRQYSERQISNMYSSTQFDEITSTIL